MAVSVHVVCWGILFHFMMGFPCLTISGAKGQTKISGTRGYYHGYTQQAIERLSQVFGIDQIPTLNHHRTPPEYMTQLYNTVAFNDGISKRSTPYEADVVRGIPDRATRQQSRYYFNVSHVAKTEDILVAELHLYKMRGQYQSQEILNTGSHVVQLRLYQVLSENWEHEPAGKLKQIDNRRISAHGTGWNVFTVTDTIRQWVNGSQPNHGFLITATSLTGHPVNGTSVRFAQRFEHHDSKQPILVVFSGQAVSKYFSSNAEAQDSIHKDSVVSDAGNPSTPEDLDSIRQRYIKHLNEGYRAENGDFPYESYKLFMSERHHNYLLEETRKSRLADEQKRSRSNLRPRRGKRDSKISRTRRGSEYYRYPNRRKNKACQRSELYIDFEEIGWAGWIISPKGYNAYHCWGECPFPLGQYHRPTNHATVQSIAYTMRIEKGIALPCCVPDKLFSVSLLYFDDEENVILKQYDEMVAASCGCH